MSRNGDGLKRYWAGYRRAEENIYMCGIDHAADMVDESTGSVTAAKGYMKKIHHELSSNPGLAKRAEDRRRGEIEWGMTLARRMERLYGDEMGRWKVFGLEDGENGDIVEGYARYYGYANALELETEYSNRKNFIALRRL